MTQLALSMYTNYRLLTLLIVILVCMNYHQTSANRLNSKSDYRQRLLAYNDFSDEDLDDSELPPVNSQSELYMPEYEEAVYANPWSRLFHQHYDRSTYTPNYYSSPKSGFALRRSSLRYIPYLSSKRSIPVELQKALFAHGIVGRRR